MMIILSLTESGLIIISKPKILSMGLFILILRPLLLLNYAVGIMLKIQGTVIF